MPEVVLLPPTASSTPVRIALQSLWQHVFPALTGFSKGCALEGTLPSPQTSSESDLGLLCAQLGQCLRVLFQKAGGHHEGACAGVMPCEEEGQQGTLQGQQGGSHWRRC